MPVASVNWHRGFHEPEDVTVSIGSDLREFDTYSEALSWAKTRTSQVRVWVEGLGEWKTEPTEEENEAIEAHIERARLRFAAEHREYDGPVEWFVAFLEPYVDDLDALVVDANTAPELRRARVLTRPHRGKQEHWLIATVHAQSRDEASGAANDALIRLVWPEERIAAALSEGGQSFFSIGQHEISGLAAYEHEEFG